MLSQNSNISWASSLPPVGVLASLPVSLLPAFALSSSRCVASDALAPGCGSPISTDAVRAMLAALRTRVLTPSAVAPTLCHELL